MKYEWTSFYEEFATKLLDYKENRILLIQKIKNIYANINMKLPTLDKEGKLVDIDPFTVFGLFNKGISNTNRIAIAKGIAEEFGIEAAIPNNFNGVPVLNNLRATFYQFQGERSEDDIDNLWNVFNTAICYANAKTPEHRETLIRAYDIAQKQKLIKWNLSIALYWVRPYVFINLDNNTRNFVTNKDRVSEGFLTVFQSIRKRRSDVPNGETYVLMCEQTLELFNDTNNQYHSFPELSYCAWEKAQEENSGIVNSNSVDVDVKSVNFWLYAPGHNADKWDEFYRQGIMGIGWDEIGNLKEYASKEDIKSHMQHIYDETLSFRNDAHCLWQFANEMKEGDIVFAKKGMHKIIGKGIVTSDYIYDATRDTYKHIRKVNWVANGEWEHPGQAVMKTLTNISDYPDYVDRMNLLFDDITEDDDINQREIIYPLYEKEDFLTDVFLNETEYDTLVELLNLKNNIILQGAPGVGKTFTAKRLAYSIMGEKDDSRVALVQFHQSYSYEDFMQGYRPAKDGFNLENGVFYKFCKAAEEDNERPYFFIIDEINRGNLSKIFGELMILIEGDKRGEKIKLLYSNEWFSVPKNVRIIGMMNTADRSLALLDYALRRRFAFYEFKPAFGTEGFETYLQEKNSSKLEKLISVVKRLNQAISDDESLGEGFQIGHSYFCTEKDVTDEWLRIIVEYEIIPLIKEYWFDDLQSVREWSELLRGAIK